MKEQRLYAELKHASICLGVFFKWVLISGFCGILIGLIGTAFSYSMSYATNFRLSHPLIILALPAGGIFIIFLYHFLKNEGDTGTNLVLSSVHSGDDVPLRMAPCIFIATVTTHLFGGSAGREGAALQLGGSIGCSIGKFLRLDEDGRRIITMCGMSAAFSALFGTPMAAAIFPMEAASVGIMRYSALVPCVIASLTAHQIAAFLGLGPESFQFTTGIPDLSLQTGCIAAALAAGCALVSVLLCVTLHEAGHLYKHYIHNPYLRAAFGGVIVAGLTFLVGSQAYNGAGMNFIEQFFEEETVFPAAFLLKILFTACTLGAGFKGGEIVPTLYTGAAFGCLFGMVNGFSTDLCTAVGMAALFCGVTNSPVSSLLLSFELFGYEGMPYYLIAIAVSHMLSGHFSLYSSQQMVEGKIKI